MGIADKARAFADNIQTGVKTTSASLFSLFLKILTGFFIGLTFALVGQEMMAYGTFGFLFVMITTLSVVVRVLANWGVGAVLIFDLFCVLVGLLLRMYILLAP